MLIPCTSKSGIFLGALLASPAFAKPERANANTRRQAMRKIFIISSLHELHFERCNCTAATACGQACQACISLNPGKRIRSRGWVVSYPQLCCRSAHHLHDGDGEQ